ncbi:MAG: hypothetical protein JST54_10880 [Deltaproteobacteria bacterium]|nr:hypothetical protein [Deltaproteobacteria bacterium]
MLRRNSGGRALHIGEGTVGVLLALPEMGALLSQPLAPSKVLNRYVRGLLAGLTRAGAPEGAHYFGRDFVSARGQQLAVIGQDNGTRAAIFEALIALDRPLELDAGLNAYLPHLDPRVAGPPHSTLSALAGMPITCDALAEAIAAGYAEVHSAQLERVDLPSVSAELEPPVDEHEEGFSDSGVADIPIGFAEALVQHDGERVQRARLRGDFIAPSFVMRELERALEGCPLTLDAVGQRVDQAFHQPGACIHGLRELRVLAEAVLAAAGKL